MPMTTPQTVKYQPCPTVSLFLAIEAAVLDLLVIAELRELLGTADADADQGERA